MNFIGLGRLTLIIADQDEPKGQYGSDSDAKWAAIEA